MGVRSPMTILVVTPITQEYDAFTSALKEFGHSGASHTVGRLDAMEFDGGEIIVAQGGLGKAQFGVQTQHLLDNLGDIGAVVCAGTCGRLDESLSVGDVVVGTHTVEHDFNRGETLIKMPLPTFEGDAALIEALRGVADSGTLPCNVRFGGVASGDEGIASEKRTREIVESTGAIVVAWEGAGGARAAQLSGVPFLEIRGISDGAGENALEEFWANIPIAVANVAAVVRELPGLVG